MFPPTGVTVCAADGIAMSSKPAATRQADKQMPKREVMSQVGHCKLHAKRPGSDMNITAD
jgi:hypothetical protein